MHFPGAAPTILKLRHAATVLSTVRADVAHSLRLYNADRQRIDWLQLIAHRPNARSRSSISLVQQNHRPARLLDRTSTWAEIPLTLRRPISATSSTNNKRTRDNNEPKLIPTLVTLTMVLLISLGSHSTAQIAPFDDFKHSATHYAPKAKAGDPLAQLYLGITIEALGENAEVRYGAARYWIAKAASAGLPEAQLRLAQIDLASGNRTSAKKNLTAASVAGLAEAQFNLAVLAENDGEAAKAQQQYEAAAHQGFGLAQFNLALMILADPNGDAPSALAWLILAAEQGTPNAAEARNQVEATLTAENLADASKRAAALR